VTTAVETEPAIPPEVAPTKPPKLNSAAFKEVPPDRSTRDSVRAAVAAFCKSLDKSKPLTKESTKEMATGILKSLGMGDNTSASRW